MRWNDARRAERLAGFALLTYLFLKPIQNLAQVRFDEAVALLVCDFLALSCNRTGIFFFRPCGQRVSDGLGISSPETIG
jgi:hypothetical protein